MISVIKDKDLIFDVFNYDVILVGTSIYCSLGNGFQHDIKINFPVVNEANINSKYADPEKLGTILPIKDRNITFCLCYINSGRFRPDLQKDYLNYDALNKCLTNVNKLFPNKLIGSTLIGKSIFEGNGNENKILDIVNNTCINCNITLYDYEQESVKDRNYREWQYIKSLIGKVSKEEYYKIKNDYLWRKKHGIWNSKSN